MKQYVIDQLREEDHELIQNYLDKSAEKTILEGIYWVDLPEHLYTVLQVEHSNCRPFYFAVMLTPTQVAFELLIRSRQTMRCTCIGYATPQQRDYIIQFADRMLEHLNIRI